MIRRIVAAVKVEVEVAVEIEIEVWLQTLTGGVFLALSFDQLEVVTATEAALNSFASRKFLTQVRRRTHSSMCKVITTTFYGTRIAS